MGLPSPCGTCGTGALGALTAPSVHALTGFGLWVNPGGSTNALTCGWHSTCLDPWPAGNALDWGNTGTQPVYWRSWATSDAGSGTMAYGYPRDASSSTCYGAAVDVYSLGWAFRGTAVYLHTASTTTASFNINGSWIGSYTSGGQVGTTVSTEKTGDCPWTAAHLHQYSTALGWYANSGVYPSAPTGGTGYSLTDQANWQNRTS